jgi:aspartyl-tRNA synthetase
VILLNSVIEVMKPHRNKKMKRTCYCGQVDKKYINKEVTLVGWVQKRRDLGGLIFIDLRDREGIVQLIFDPEKDKKLFLLAEKLRSEFVIGIKGLVVERKSSNKNLETGNYEIQVSDLTIFSKSKVPPFQIDANTDSVTEDLRLKYRYLDLRRKKMQKHFKIRHYVAFAMRKFLNDRGFFEMETPILSKSTPEGAQDFLVPTSIQPGTFYALPQSPQIYKQLLMTSGFDKYFQIARCFRDEALRANRQPEFTQLDMEMSFVDEKDVQEITESLIKEIWNGLLKYKLPKTFPSITFKEAFAKYGTDKPDVRFDLEINDATSLFKDTEIKFLKSVIDFGGKLGAVCFKKQNFSRSELDKWVDVAKERCGAKGLLYIHFAGGEDAAKNKYVRPESNRPDHPECSPSECIEGRTVSTISKLLPKDFFSIAKKVFPELEAGDTLFIVADNYKDAWTILGRLRLELAKSFNLIDENKFEFLWVTDFPLLEWNEEDKRFYAMHHPFTQPKEGEVGLDPKDMVARAYDLVCNGEELGGGSIRIHDPKMQTKMFDLLGIAKKEAQEKFGFLLEAMEFGFPPHGGIALGLDRLIMTIAKTDSIRDVIAFPKTTSGSCLMMQTPSKVDTKQLDVLKLQVK